MLLPGNITKKTEVEGVGNLDEDAYESLMYSHDEIIVPILKATPPTPLF